MQRTLVLSLVLAAIFAAPLGPLFFAPSAALFAAPLAPPFAASLAPLFAVLFAPVAHSQCLEDVLTAQNTTLSTLYAWLQSQELVLDTISRAQGVTLLAPSNNALDQLYASQLPTQLANDPNLLVAFLSYHALPGVYFFDDFLSVPAAAVPSFMNMAAFSNVSGGQVVRSRSKNGGVTFVTGNNAESNVQACDFTYDGGTLHIIDSVLTIPGRLTDTLVAGGLTSFAGALQRAGVESTLNNAKDVTVFAPYNDAFNAISSLVNAMTPEQLSQVLSYHVVRDKVLYSWLIADGTTQVTAAGGARLNFRVVNGALYVNSARVIASDVLVGNGVVHVLDSVLNPANQTATPDPSAATPAPAFNEATTATAGVPFTSAVVTSTVVSTATGPGVPQPTTSAAGPGPAPTAASEDSAPVETAALCVGVLFGGAAAFVNW